MLKYALEPHGFGEVFAAGAEMKKKVTPVEDKEEVDNAAKAVMELFCQQVCLCFSVRQGKNTYARVLMMTF